METCKRRLRVPKILALPINASILGSKVSRSYPSSGTKNYRHWRWRDGFNTVIQVQDSFSLFLQLISSLAIMSFLGRGSAPPTGGINPERIEIATAEYVLRFSTSRLVLTFPSFRLDMITDVFNRLVSSAFLFSTHIKCNNLNIPTFSKQIMSHQMYWHALRGGRPEQGRERLRRPLRRKILRGQQKGRGEDAANGCKRASGWNVRLVIIYSSSHCFHDIRYATTPRNIGTV